MKSVYLNIGSNRGDRERNIERAIEGIRGLWPEAQVRVSPTVESEAWGYESAHRFLNTGVALDFEEDQLPEAMEVLRGTQAVEREVSTDPRHRNEDGSYRDREIDIDIIDIDGVEMESDELTIPHPRAEARDFVMRPMEFLCPGWRAKKEKGEHQKKRISEMGRASVEEYQAKEKLGIAVVLDNVRSLNNIGSIFRTADAFMVEKVVLCGISATPPSAEIHKTALGAEESVKWEYHASTHDAVEKLRCEGWTIACLEQVHGSVSLENYEPGEGEKVAIVAGNEVHGVDAAIVAEADVYLEIPQGGTKHSLNVAVSTAIALWHLFEKKKKA